MPAERIVFSATAEADTGIRLSEKPYSDADTGIRLLGEPFIEEVREAMTYMLSLLQVDEDDRWNLQFHDCGMLNFLIHPTDLRQRRWDKARCYLFSF